VWHSKLFNCAAKFCPSRSPLEAYSQTEGRPRLAWKMFSEITADGVLLNYPFGICLSRAP